MNLLKKFKNFLSTPIFSNKCNWECNQGRNCTCTLSFTPAMIEVHSLSNKVPQDIRIELLKIEQRIAELGNEYYERRNNITGETQD